MVAAPYISLSGFSELLKSCQELMKSTVYLVYDQKGIKYHVKRLVTAEAK